MAITFVTGIARSGKSYFSTYRIYMMYKNDLPVKSKYKIINEVKQWFSYYIKPNEPKKYYETTYTNINQFNFDFHPRVKKLDFEDLKVKLKQLHRLHVEDGNDDDVLIEKAKELNLHNCLIVVDEGAHHFTKPVDKVLVWWLTYHGHLFQDIHIITQHMDQIPTEYLKNGEFFYKVYPPSKAIFANKFSLGLYSCLKFFKNCKVEDITIPFLPEVGNLYVSGKKAERKPILKKFIPIFIVLFVLLYWSISSFFSMNDEQIEEFKKDKNSSLSTASQNIESRDIGISKEIGPGLNVSIK